MDELERRKALRQQQKQQRQEKRRKLYTRLVIAGILLLGMAVLIFVVSCQSTDEPPAQTQSPVQTTPSLTDPTAPGLTDPPTTQPPQKDQVIRITAVGDLNVTEKTVAAGGAGYDYTQVFQDVLPVLAQADLTVVNLEGILCGAPYGTDDRSAPQTMMTALANAGVDLVQIANSYSIKNGVAGLSLTISGLQAAGLEGVGAYARNEDFERTGGYTLRNVNGIKVAFVALTKGMNGMALPEGSENCVNLLYTDYSSTYKNVNTEGITELLERVQEQEPDVTVALVHWGSEYNDTTSDSQKRIQDLMLANGVDAIIGTHPHYVQKLEYDAAAGTVVAYSLGDFLSDGDVSGTEYSIALHLEITKNSETGETSITGCDYTPLFTAAGADGSLRILRMEAAMRAYEEQYIDRVSAAVYDAMVYAASRIEARVKGE